MMSNKISIKKIIIPLFWIGLWQLLSSLLGKEILLPSPIRVLSSLWYLAQEESFWTSLFFSLSSITLGLILSLIIATILGLFSYHLKDFRELLKPLMGFLRAVPLVSFTILILIYTDSSALSTIVPLIMTLPIIYQGILSSLTNIDPKIMEMIRSFKVSKFKTLKFIYLPQIKKALIPLMITCTGIGLKSGVAAEVIGLKEKSIGEGLYLSKIYLETADLFAWTLVIVLISLSIEKIVNYIGEKNVDLW